MSVTLDPDRQARAAGRARAALAAAQHHDGEAARERSKAMSICCTWNLDPISLEPLTDDNPLSSNYDGSES